MSGSAGVLAASAVRRVVAQHPSCTSGAALAARLQLAGRTLRATSSTSRFAIATSSSSSIFGTTNGVAVAVPVQRRGFSSAEVMRKDPMDELGELEKPPLQEPPKKKHASEMTPPELVAELDRFIIGQAPAKKWMANAIRYRWRRKQLNESARDECNPRNILLKGPTGCGKTEIARRLAKLVDAPFICAEATKFTEVGFHGRDIESVIRDLMEAGIKMQRKKLEDEYRPLATAAVNDYILERLIGDASKDEREGFGRHLEQGWLDQREIEVEVPVAGSGNGSSMMGGGDSDVSGGSSWVGGGMPLMLGGSGSKKTEKRKLKISEARVKLLQAELDNRITQDEVITKALKSVEDDGMIFLDEIDKIVSPKGHYGPDASSEGVQRDLLPIIEGTTVNTKYGAIKSDHILFVCAGSFHSVKVSDMLAELQGRLPVRIELHALTVGDFYRILAEPEFGIIQQNVALMGTEAVELEWTESALREVASFWYEMNTYIENVGARRLHTIVEKVTEDMSYKAHEFAGTRVVIDEEFVRARLADVEIDKSVKGLL